MPIKKKMRHDKMGREKEERKKKLKKVRRHGIMR